MGVGHGGQGGWVMVMFPLRCVLAAEGNARVAAARTRDSGGADDAAARRMRRVGPGKRAKVAGETGTRLTRSPRGEGEAPAEPRFPWGTVHGRDARATCGRRLGRSLAP